MLNLRMLKPKRLVPKQNKKSRMRCIAWREYWASNVFQDENLAYGDELLRLPEVKMRVLSLDNEDNEVMCSCRRISGHSAL